MHWQVRFSIPRYVFTQKESFPSRSIDFKSFLVQAISKMPLVLFIKIRGGGAHEKGQKKKLINFGLFYVFRETCNALTLLLPDRLTSLSHNFFSNKKMKTIHLTDLVNLRSSTLQSNISLIISKFFCSRSSTTLDKWAWPSRWTATWNQMNADCRTIAGVYFSVYMLTLNVCGFITLVVMKCIQ